MFKATKTVEGRELERGGGMRPGTGNMAMKPSKLVFFFSILKLHELHGNQIQISYAVVIILELNLIVSVWPKNNVTGT